MSDQWVIAYRLNGTERLWIRDAWSRARLDATERLDVVRAGIRSRAERDALVLARLELPLVIDQRPLPLEYR